MQREVTHCASQLFFFFYVEVGWVGEVENSHDRTMTPVSPNLLEDGRIRQEELEFETQGSKEKHPGR